MYATLLNAIVTGQDSHLPIVNLGDNLTHIRKTTFVRAGYSKLNSQRTDVFVVDQDANISET